MKSGQKSAESSPQEKINLPISRNAHLNLRTNNMNRAIMATGGIDSTLLMYEAAKEGIPTLLSVNYGQITWNIQQELINHHAKILGFLPVVELSIIYHSWQMASRGLFDAGYMPKNLDPLASWDTLLHEDYYIEGRNAIMLLYALAWCSKHKIDELWTGYEYEADEWQKTRTYKMITDDTSPHFVDALNLLAITGFSHHVRIRAPFLERRMGKNNIVAEYSKYSIDLNKTYSCYRNCFATRKYSHQHKICFQTGCPANLSGQK